MIKIDMVTKKYGNTVILEQASYTFPQTGIVCLMGASGGGKTTLLHLLAGFDSDYEGEILVGGTPIHQMDDDTLCNYRRDNIGFVFQNYHLLPGYTVLENVTLAGELSGEQPNSIREKATALLSRLGITGKESQKTEHLSGGQKQRAAIARALLRDPQILFADEPTGALDRATSTEIMELLHEVANDRLVIVITHDPKICAFADQIIHIKDKKIVVEPPVTHTVESEKPLQTSDYVHPPALARAKKNFKVHLKRYLAVSLAISIGILAFLFSLSFGNVIEQAVTDFTQKNTAFNNGYIKGADDGTILKQLKEDARLENVYYQYKLDKISLSFDDKTEVIAEKFPTPKTGEGVSYGVMPGRGQNEIALTPSLAKKFSASIDQLLGQKLTLTYDQKPYSLTISGIYNAGYDDFIISSDVEQQLYQNLPNQSNYAISYDVRDFSKIVAVSDSLKQQGFPSVNAADEVAAFAETFDGLSKLFAIISILVFVISLFICGVLLFKLQNTRYHELGLLSALGFNRRHITAIITAENVLLAALATVVNLCLLGFLWLLSKLLHLPLIITGAQLGLSVIATFAVVILLSWAASYRLVRTEPAVALKK